MTRPGDQWPIREAILKRRLSLLDRVVPWKRVPVTLHVGPGAEIDLSTVISRIGDVLRSASEFCEDLTRAVSSLA
jgi:hypothetical protein